MEFSDYLAAHGQALMRLAYVMTGDRQNAEDLTQEALLQLFRRWSGLRDPHAYARRSIINGAITIQRRNVRDTARRHAPDVSIADHSTSVVMRDELWIALRRLPARQRAVVVLRYLQDLSDKDIATVLKIREASVRSTAVRALASLREAQALETRGAKSR